MNKEDLKTLGVLAAKIKKNSGSAYSFNSESFTYSQVQDTFRNELNAYIGTDIYSFEQNKLNTYRLMAEVITDVLPERVIDQYGNFAEIKKFAQGDKPVFTQKVTAASKRRAKQFITKVGHAGVYEVFKLDGRSYTIETSAFGGAAQIGFEEFLDGRVDMSEVLDIIMEGLNDAVFLEIERALKASVDKLPAANKYVDTEFVEKEMDDLIAIADSYGGKGAIYCTYEFAATMIPSKDWVSDNMRDQRWNNGYFTTYKSHPVFLLNQSFEDENNEVKVIDPSYAYIIPTGVGQKPVTLAFEGDAIVKEFENRDYSKEIQVYQKFGAVANVTNNICIYQNTSLKRTKDTTTTTPGGDGTTSTINGAMNAINSFKTAVNK